MNRKHRMFGNKHGTLRDLRQRDLDCFLKLRVTSRKHVSGRDLNVEIGRDTNVFHAPRRSTRIVRGAIGELNPSSVDKRRCKVIGTYAPTKRSLANDWTNLRKLEH